jgi:hypothetical protein
MFRIRSNSDYPLIMRIMVQTFLKILQSCESRLPVGRVQTFRRNEITLLCYMSPQTYTVADDSFVVSTTLTTI